MRNLQKTLLLIFVVSFVLYSLFSGKNVLSQSAHPHFVYLADSILHGQLSLYRERPHDNGWAVYKGRTYVSFPPLPAFLMLPFVRVFGMGFNDVIFTIVFAASNIALIYLLLHNINSAALGAKKRPTAVLMYLAFIFAFGALHLYCSIIGEVWYTAEAIGATCTILYLVFSLEAIHPFLAGIFLGCAFITRPSLLFGFPFFFVQLGAVENPREEKEKLRKAIYFLLPILIIGAGMAVLNYIRFDNPLEFGHSYLISRMYPPGAKLKLFIPSNFLRNASIALFRLPRFQPRFPFIAYDLHGMSIFFTTPVFLYIFGNLYNLVMKKLDSKEFRLSLGCWISTVLIAIVHFFYQSYGQSTFGYRFSLDYTPYLMILLMLVIRALIGRLSY